jgi:hypothetical protein
LLHLDVFIILISGLIFKKSNNRKSAYVCMNSSLVFCFGSLIKNYIAHPERLTLPTCLYLVLGVLPFSVFISYRFMKAAQLKDAATPRRI